jgi:microcompartment protein CcmK/EutM
MRVAKVVGKVSLSKVHSTLVGKRWVLAQPVGLRELTAPENVASDEVVALDEIGAGEGDLVGMAEGAEAAFPFHPVQVPLDAYIACLLDQLDIDEKQVAKLLAATQA